MSIHVIASTTHVVFPKPNHVCVCTVHNREHTSVCSVLFCQYVLFCSVRQFSYDLDVCSVLSVSSVRLSVISVPFRLVRPSVCYVHPFPSRPSVCLLCPSRPVSSVRLSVFYVMSVCPAEWRSTFHPLLCLIIKKGLLISGSVVTSSDFDYVMLPYVLTIGILGLLVCLFIILVLYALYRNKSQNRRKSESIGEAR